MYLGQRSKQRDQTYDGIQTARREKGRDLANRAARAITEGLSSSVASWLESFANLYSLVFCRVGEFVYGTRLTVIFFGVVFTLHFLLESLSDNFQNIDLYY